MSQDIVRHCLALDLNDEADLISAYEEWHKPGRVPQRVIQSIGGSGIADMQIWQCTDRMFMIMETPPDFDPDKKASHDAETPDVVAWERLMMRLQKALPIAARVRSGCPWPRSFR